MINNWRTGVTIVAWVIFFVAFMWVAVTIIDGR